MGGFGHDWKYAEDSTPIIVIDTEIDGPHRFVTVNLTWEAAEKLRDLLNDKYAP